MKKEKRVINISKDEFDIIKKYCEKHTLDMVAWITRNSMEKIIFTSVVVNSKDKVIKESLNCLFDDVLKVNENFELWREIILRTQHLFLKLNVSVGGISSVENINKDVLIETKFIGNVPHRTYKFNQEVLEKHEMIHFDNSFIDDIDRCILDGLNKVAIIHLYSSGYRNEDMVNFSIDLKKSPLE